MIHCMSNFQKHINFVNHKLPPTFSPPTLENFVSDHRGSGSLARKYVTSYQTYTGLVQT